MTPLGQHQAHPNHILTRTAGYLSGTARLALDLLFPPTCAVCGREGRFLCERCEGANSNESSDAPLDDPPLAPTGLTAADRPGDQGG